MNTIPTITQLYSGIRTDLESTYGSNIPVFGKNFLRALSAVQAGKLWLGYLLLGSVQKNIFIDTADPEARGGTLERFGRVKLGRNPFPATAGQYEVEVTGSIGGVIPASTTWKSNDDSLNPGKMFVLDLEYILVAETDTITVRALEAGTDSKLEVGDLMSLTAPLSFVNTTATVLTETVEPLAAEDIEEYRRKGLDAYRLEPQGGAAADYRLWASDAQGVQQSYPYARTGDANEINLFVEATIADSTDGKGTPSESILEEVEEVVEFDPDTSQPLSARGRRPLGVFQVHFLPISPLDVVIAVNGYEGITPTIAAAIEAAMIEMVDAIRPFVAAVDILAYKNDILNTNKIIAVILDVEPGAVFDDITLTVDGNEVTSFTFTAGDIPYFGSITFP